LPKAQPLRDRLKQLGIKQADLAAKVGCHRHYLSAVATGAIYASPRMRRDISAALGIPAEELFRAE
jgi:transcriptional regulator with XRE-family HTH domain